MERPIYKDGLTLCPHCGSNKMIYDTGAKTRGGASWNGSYWVFDLEEDNEPTLHCQHCSEELDPYEIEEVED